MAGSRKPLTPAQVQRMSNEGLALVLERWNKWRMGEVEDIEFHASDLMLFVREAADRLRSMKQEGAGR